jgi:hypothetical protein
MGRGRVLADGAPVAQGFRRNRGYAEGEVLAYARYVARVEGFALSRWLGAYGVPGVVGPGVLRGRGRVIGW